MARQSIHALAAASVSLGVALLLLLLGWAALVQPAFASTGQTQEALAAITVNTITPAATDDGLCSIIEAIENANADAPVFDDCAAGSGHDVISLPSDAILIFTTTHNVMGGANALPVISTTMTIEGNGAALVRDSAIAPLFRFFNVAVEGNLTLNELEMRNGHAGLVGTVQLLSGGGAIVNQGTLHIIDSNLSLNRASFGGAIYSESASGSLTLNNTTFTSNTADLHGGALYNLGPATISGGEMRANNAAGGNGGAILHDSSALTLLNVAVQENLAAGAGAGIAARAAFSNSQLSIRTSTVVSNAAGSGGGLYNSAGNGMTSRIDLTGSSVIGNRATSTATLEGVGGGILNGWAQGNGGGVAELHVSQSSILENAAQIGGGIANLDAAPYLTRTAHVVVSQSTLAHNVAAGTGAALGTGGGLYNSNGTASVVNSTISGNQAVGDDTVFGGRGGGIGNVGRGVTTTLQLLNSTVAFNQATQAGGGIAVVGRVTATVTATSIAMNVGNTLVVSNALVVTPTITNALVLATMAAPQVMAGTESCSIENGVSNSLGGNIEDGTTCGFTAATDRADTSVALEPLADNGGPTLTHMIAKTSAAVNNGVSALCAAAPVNSVDQRNVIRPQGAGCDVGAVERFDVEGTTLFPQIYLRHSFTETLAQSLP